MAFGLLELCAHTGFPAKIGRVTRARVSQAAVRRPGRIASFLQGAVQPLPAMIPLSEVAPDLNAVPAQGRSREHQAVNSHCDETPSQ